MSASSPLTALVVSSDPECRARLRALLITMDQYVLEASGTAQALETMHERTPDVVFACAARGLTARTLRNTERQRLPVAMILPNGDASELARQVAQGADWVLPGVPEADVLASILEAARERRDLEAQLREKTELLEQHAARMEDEITMARRVLDGVARRQDEDFGGLLRSWIVPAVQFSGDVVCAARAPDGSFRVLFADAVGHGLAAALTAIPLRRVFFAMTRKGFALPSVVLEMNQALSLPGRFVAATLVSFHPKEERLAVWNGGNPDAVLLDDAGKVVKRFSSRHLPLGIAGVKLDPEPETMRVPRGCQLLLCSDGLLEAQSPEGVPYGEARLLESVSWCAPAARVHASMTSLRTHMAGRGGHDDISLALLDCSGRLLPEPEILQAPAAADRPRRSKGGSGWRFTLRLSPDCLRKTDSVPLLQHVVDELEPGHSGQGALYLVLSELFTNAVDHGLLGMNSTIKQGDDGFELYLAERTRRLEALASGEVRIELTRLPGDDEDLVRIRVTDTGPGFDFQQWLEGEAQSHGVQRHSRGIALVRSLAHDLAYVGNGNEAVAHCRI